MRFRLASCAAPHDEAEAVDPDVLEQLLADGEVDGLEYAYCPQQGRTTAHAMHADGSRRCWDCGTTTSDDQ